MSDPDPRFDTLHPGGQVLVRTCRGGHVHSVVLGEAAMDAGAAALARAILLASEVSHLKAVMAVRGQILDAGLTPSAELASRADLDAARVVLESHRLPA